MGFGLDVRLSSLAPISTATVNPAVGVFSLAVLAALAVDLIRVAAKKTNPREGPKFGLPGADPEESRGLVVSSSPGHTVTIRSMTISASWVALKDLSLLLEWGRGVFGW